MILLYALLIGLAAYRAYRIIAEDSITEPLRDWLYDTEKRVTISHPAGKGAWIEERTQHRHVRSFLADLFTCPWCIGFWYCGIGAWLVADLENYNPAEFALVWLAASGICGLTKGIDK